MSDPKPFNINNELVKERNRAAAERTLLAWIRRCLSLITFGVALDQIYNAVAGAFPRVTEIFGARVATSVSLVFILLGIGLLILAIVQYRLTLKDIQRSDYLHGAARPLNRIVTIAIAIFGILSFIAVLIQATG
ncbi:MAG: YidH family protein [Spirulina sp.]